MDYDNNNEADIPMQRKACHRFADKMGWTIVHEEQEDGVSGHKIRAENRDKIQAIKELARKGKFDILLVFMFDRIGRIADETPFVVEWFVKNGIQVWSTQEGEQRFDNHIDKLLNYIRFWQADGESEKTSIRTRTSLGQMVEEGHYKGGNAALGYMLVKSGRVNKRKHELYDLKVKEEDAAIVRLIFDKYTKEGLGVQKIANFLNNGSYSNPTGNRWSYNTIRNVLHNPTYIGYLRSGDKATLTARVSNTSDKTLKGTGVMQLIDPENDHIVYTSRQPFQVMADSVSSLTFTYTPGEQTPALLTCKIAVMADGMTDGEQHYLPVLPSVEPQLNTYSFTLPGPTNSLIDVKQLFPAGCTDKRFTFEYTNNPAWLMVEALHEYAHPYDDCAICQAMALFSQDIATSLGSHEEINAAIQRWNEEQDSVTALSPLERNDEVKNILHEETPWLMAAENERKQKEHLLSLFDQERQKKLHNKALNALRMLQNGDGSWSWFPGMPGSPYITHVVSELLVRSNALCGRHLDTQPMLDEAFHYMGSKGADLHYLYLCALDGRHPSDSLRREVRKELKALRREAKSNDISDIYSAAVKAIVLDAFNEKGAEALLDQIMALTVTERTLGRYFDSYLAPYSWLDYKIPTQVMVIEALERIRPDDEKKIAEMRQWLLQEKRSQYWVTPIQSANAIYAFLRGNMESLNTYSMPTITIDGETVDTKTGTGTLGYVKTTHPAKEASEINIIKHERHTSWGTVYAQYMQRSEDVEATGNDLQVHREIIAPHGGALRVGDKVRVRITLTAKRDLDFVQVNDRRAACLEPVDPLSGYRNGYYVQNRDCTTQYFISMLSKGTHVIEKEFYVDRAGTYHSGSITAQCAYAPEFMGTEGRYTVKIEN